MNELTADELTILIDAVDSWIDKDFGDSIFTGMLGALTMGRARKEAPEEWANFQADEARRKSEASVARELRKEQGTILKAKLMQMRRALRVGQEHAVGVA